MILLGRDHIKLGQFFSNFSASFLKLLLLFSVLFLIYLPMAVAGYYAYGSSSPSYIVKVLPHGPIRIIIEVMLLLHLVSAFPIITNPPAQYFEQLFKIPSGERETTIALCKLPFVHTLNSRREFISRHHWLCRQSL